MVLLRHTLKGGSQVSARVFWYSGTEGLEQQQAAVQKFTGTLSSWWAANDPFLPFGSVR